MINSQSEHKKIVLLLMVIFVAVTLACSSLGIQSQPTLTPIPTDTQIPATPTQTATPLPPTETLTPTPARPNPPKHVKVKFNCQDVRWGRLSTLIGYDVNIIISWQDNSQDEAGFNVYRNDKLIKTVEMNMTSFTDYDRLSIGGSGSAQYEIAAYNDVGNSSKSAATITYRCK